MNYISSPQLTLDGFLRQEKIRLPCLHDGEMIRLIKDNIRGGISTINTRYAKANNPYMTDFDPKNEHTYLLYLDCVNLYGFASYRFQISNG